MAITLACMPGSPQRTNEDWCGATDAPTRLAVVLDGVTSPGPTGCRHGTPWYVQQLGASLLSLAAVRENTLARALETSIMNVSRSHADSCDLSHPGTPAAAVAVVRLHEQQLDYLVLADTTVVLVSGDGHPQVISDPRVNTVATSHVTATTHHEIGSPEHRAAINAMSNEQRRWRNQPDGYWVAAADPSAAHQALTSTVNRSDIQQAALFSDGASRIVDVFGDRTWPEAMHMLTMSGPDSLIARVRDIEQHDPAGIRWPRFKASDDAACINIVQP